MKVFILPHAASNGCAALAKALGVKRIKRENSSFTPDFSKLVLNWGNSLEGRLPRFMAAHSNWINNPEAVGKATNKLSCWHALHAANVPTVIYTTDISEVCRWLEGGLDVVARTKLQSSGGDGIVMLEAEQFKDYSLRKIFDTLTGTTYSYLWRTKHPPVFTQYFKAKEEYRVHVLRDQIIDVQQKRRRTDVPNDEVNYKVRSHANGFVFCRENVEVPDAVLAASVDAISALGLDFGAVDVRWNGTLKTPCVLEINTAPGLEGSTVENYCAAFTELFNSLNV